MQGTVLNYNEEDGTGTISGEDGNRYQFVSSDAQGNNKITRASKVDFIIEDGTAKEIYKVVGSMESLAGDKNKFIAGLLGIFFGTFGVHKFYLGRKKQGIMMLSAFIFSWILMMTVIGVFIGGPVLWVLYMIGFIEGVILIIKPQDEFQRIYIDGDKAWF